jgi:hypothetical protein
MNNETTMRGYDDSDLLQKMAEGLVTREFGSVDEAAKVVLGEESGSNVDRLRRKFREQGWYEVGLSQYVEAKITERGLISPSKGARLGAEVDRLCQDPRPALIYMVKLLRVLALRQFDVDGRRLTKKMMVGGWMRLYSGFMIPLTIFNVLIALIRTDAYTFGVEMLTMAALMLILGGGMYWNRLLLTRNLDELIEADDRGREADRTERRAMRQKRHAERQAAKLRLTDVPTEAS